MTAMRALGGGRASSGDVAEQAVLDAVPLRVARRIVSLYSSTF
jgi:hypothetical protein